MTALPNSLVWHEGSPPDVDYYAKEPRPLLVEYADGVIQSYGQGNFAGGFCDCCSDGRELKDGIRWAWAWENSRMSARNTDRAARTFEHERRICAELARVPRLGITAAQRSTFILMRRISTRSGVSLQRTYFEREVCDRRTGLELTRLGWASRLPGRSGRLTTLTLTDFGMWVLSGTPAHEGRP